MKGKILKFLGGALLAATVLAAGLVMSPEVVKADGEAETPCNKHTALDENCPECCIATYGHHEFSDGKCSKCNYVCEHPSPEYGENGSSGHSMRCSVCTYVDSTVSEHNFNKYVKGQKVGKHQIQCSVCGYTKDNNIVGEDCEYGSDGKCLKCGLKKEDRTYGKGEEKSSSSDDNWKPEPVLTPAQQAKVTEQAQAVVGSAAYNAKQAEVQKSITTAVASVTKMTSAQAAVVAQAGVPVSLGGCTTLDNKTVATMASNSFVPYNMMFNWNGVTFSVKVPAGADYTKLIDAKGNVQMWKLVQIYGITSAVLAKY